MVPFAVILPAAGRSVRFGSERNKLLEPLMGRSVIAHTVGAFLSREDVAAIVIPTTDVKRLSAALSGGNALDPRIIFTGGGMNRADSVRHGLTRVGAGIEWVAVHDAARPLVSRELIDRTMAAAIEHGAAAPALAVNLTIKQAMGPLPSPVQRTIPRNTLFAMQTPQVIRRAALQRAFELCPIDFETVTDDAQLLELVGQDVWLVEGEERNLKITTQMDLRLAEMILGPGNPSQAGHT